MAEPAAPAPSPAPPPPGAQPAAAPPALAPASAPASAPAGTETQLLHINEFAKVKLVTAEIVEAKPHPKADKLVVMQIKIGERRKQIVAGIRLWYTPEQLVGRTIVVVDNLQPARLRGEMSEGMLLAVSLPEGGLRLLTTDGPAPSGLHVS